MQAVATITSTSEVSSSASGTNGVRPRFTWTNFNVAATSLLTTVIFPALAPSAVSLSRIAIGRGGSRTFLWFAALLAIALAVLNAGKAVESDEQTYFQYLLAITGHGTDFMDALTEVTGRGEIGFYWLSAVLFTASGQSIKVVMGFWTFVIYFASAASFARLFADRMSMARALPIFALASMTFINFALTAHVTRQYSAGSLLVLSFAYFDRRAFSFLVLVATGLIHNSALVFVLPWLYTFYALNRTDIVPRYPILICLFGICWGLGFSLYSLIDSLAAGLFDVLGVVSSALVDNGELTLFKFGVIAMTLVVLHRKLRLRFERSWLPLFNAFVFLVALIALLSKLPLFLLRFSFYVDFFACASVSILLFALMDISSRRFRGLILMALPIAANTELFVRAVTSPWVYSWVRGDISDGTLFSLLGKAFNGI